MLRGAFRGNSNKVTLRELSTIASREGSDASHHFIFRKNMIGVTHWYQLAIWIFYLEQNFIGTKDRMIRHLSRRTF